MDGLELLRKLICRTERILAKSCGGVLEVKNRFLAGVIGNGN